MRISHRATGLAHRGNSLAEGQKLAAARVSASNAAA